MQLWSLHFIIVPYKQNKKEIQYIKLRLRLWLCLKKTCPPPCKEVSATLIPNTVFRHSTFIKNFDIFINGNIYDSSKTITRHTSSWSVYSCLLYRSSLVKISQEGNGAMWAIIFFKAQNIGKGDIRALLPRMASNDSPCLWDQHQWKSRKWNDRKVTEFVSSPKSVCIRVCVCVCKSMRERETVCFGGLQGWNDVGLQYGFNETLSPAQTLSLKLQAVAVSLPLPAGTM